ncbi:hypothetical protein CPB83DRAFT_851610 [Crepidotus variabilis]|uniref:Uncharacterized protein n=1 Tax=Crepidotus variabilis TaxID=179855 RepID=A0A9P6EJK9_9AGAR|nr:hypothetical protein CPB83DRAFT_851610 [Crepidotus variabilis]
MEQESSNLYTQTMGNQPLTVLLLIENSQKMLSVWQELKEHYLNPLVETIVQSSGSVQTSFFVIESSVDTNIASYSPRQYPSSRSALMSVNFGYGLDGRISPARVEHCIQHLDGSSYNVDLSSSLHLVIVAASAPTNDCSGIAVPAAVSPWNVLADRLTERNIHCHLVMAPGQEDVSPFTLLFEHTLVQQNNAEEAPPFSMDRSRFIVRLSARPSYQTLAENGTSNLPIVNEPMLTPLDNNSCSSSDATSGRYWNGFLRLRKWYQHAWHDISQEFIPT